MLDSESTAPQVYIACSFLNALATVGIVLRLYSRIRVIGNFGADDAVLILAWALQIAVTGFLIAETHDGLGRHLKTVSVVELNNFPKMLLGSLITYNLSLCLIKISILLQYQRFLFTPFMKNLCRAVLIFIILYSITTTITTVISLVPFSCFSTSKRTSKCISKPAVWLSHASLNILTDIVIISLPLHTLANLRMQKKQKYGLIGIFTVGIVVCLISILRLNALRKVIASDDVTWSNAPLSIWSQSEISVAIFCASLPGIKPLFGVRTGSSRDTTMKSGSTDGMKRRSGASGMTESDEC